MPPPTASLKPNKAAGKDAAASKAPAPTPAAASNGNTGAGAGSDEKRTFTKPDQAAYNAEQDQINKEIAELKTKQDAIRARIDLSKAPGGNDRRSQIKAEMDSLRGEQGNAKSNRQKTFDEMKRLQEGVQKKIKDAQASRGKLGYKSVAEVDQRIDSLNRQVESGQMKLVDEKKALQEMSNLRRSRKTLEASGSVDDAIAADKARIDELKKQLDDPEAKKVSDRFDELKKEMDGLRAEGDKAFEEKNKLFEQSREIKAQQDALYARKRESVQKYREAGDEYYAGVAAQRQARQERYKSEKAKEDAARREEDITRMREEAQAPAYQAEIEDTAVLIGWFKGKYGGGEVPSTNAAKASSAANPLEGVKEHEIRKVDSDFKGMTLKKKGEDEELGGFFGGGGKSKKKGGKKGGAANGSGTQTPDKPTESAGGAINLPMSLLTALLSLGIPPPSGKDDSQRVITDLETKKAWFEANSAQKTKAEIERVEKLVAKMEKKNKTGDDTNEDALADAEESEEGGAKEPNHTAAVAGSVAGLDSTAEADHILPKDASPTEEVKHVDSALEEMKQQEAEANA